jgi:hypothetical protein
MPVTASTPRKSTWQRSKAASLGRSLSPATNRYETSLIGTEERFPPGALSTPAWYRGRTVHVRSMRPASLMRVLSFNEMAVAKALRQHGAVRHLRACRTASSRRHQRANHGSPVPLAGSCAHHLESLNAYVWSWRGPDCADGSVVFAICNTCGSVMEFDQAEIGRRSSMWGTLQSSFSLERTTIEVRGKCRTCALGEVSTDTSTEKPNKQRDAIA